MVSQLPGSKGIEYTASSELSNLNTLSLHLTQMEKMAAIGQLSSSVAHEMRNLLGMIRNATFNIDRALDRNELTVKKNLEIITRCVNRASEFIDHLLYLSSVPRGKEEMLDLCEVVDNLLTLFSKEFEWHHIRVERRYAVLPHFPIDCHALQECLLNLILNAIQSMEEGGSIIVEIKPLKKGVRIMVEDTGCGIPPENLQRIFDQFYTTKKNDQGTGLGLTIARNLAKELGGEITVESQLGKGSRFTIALPALLNSSNSELNEGLSSSQERKAM